LKASWTEFAESRKAAGKDVEYAVLKQDFFLKDEHTIVLQLTNSVKIPILDRFRADLITHLKTQLDNRHIQLETQLLEEEQSFRPYTNKEKFDYLAEKRPILRTLQERLGLDPDL
jgi:DNA polymerase-3 subunit gamma/tau